MKTKNKTEIFIDTVVERFGLRALVDLIESLPDEVEVEGIRAAAVREAATIISGGIPLEPAEEASQEDAPAPRQDIDLEIEIRPPRRRRSRPPLIPGLTRNAGPARSLAYAAMNQIGCAQPPVAYLEWAKEKGRDIEWVDGEYISLDGDVLAWKALANAVTQERSRRGVSHFTRRGKFTVTEAAKIAGVGKSYLYDEMRNGHLPFFMSRGTRTIEKKYLNAWCLRRSEKGSK